MKKLILFLTIVLMFTGCIGYALDEQPTPYTNYMASHSPSLNSFGKNVYGSIEINCARRMDSISSTYKLQKLSGGSWQDIPGTSGTYTENNTFSIIFEVDYMVTESVNVAYRLCSVATAKLGSVQDIDTAYDEIILNF